MGVGCCRLSYPRHQLAPGRLAFHVGGLNDPGSCSHVDPRGRTPETAAKGGKQSFAVTSTNDRYWPTADMQWRVSTTSSPASAQRTNSVRWPLASVLEICIVASNGGLEPDYHTVKIKTSRLARHQDRSREPLRRVPRQSVREQLLGHFHLRQQREHRRRLPPIGAAKTWLFSRPSVTSRSGPFLRSTKRGCIPVRCTIAGPK